MQDTDSSQPITPPSHARFATTHWTVVLAAGSPGSSHYREALETLCRTYWYPLYAYLRRQGYDTHLAADYTQDFFTSLIEKQSLSTADRKRGRFRSYLLGAMRHFLADERDRARAQKRGGTRKILSLDVADGENRYSHEPLGQLSPERLFQRAWALTILGKAMHRLEAESRSMHQPQAFRHLVVYMAPSGPVPPYCEMAEHLKMTEGAVKAAVYRLRRRYRQLLHDEIAQTVAERDQVEEELRDLLAALSH